MAKKLPDNMKYGTVIYEQYQVQKDEGLYAIAKQYLKDHNATEKDAEAKKTSLALHYKRYKNGVDNKLKPKSPVEVVPISDIDDISTGEVLLLPTPAPVLPPVVHPGFDGQLTVTASDGIYIRDQASTNGKILIKAADNKNKKYKYNKNTIKKEQNKTDTTNTWVEVLLDPSIKNNDGEHFTGWMAVSESTKKGTVITTENWVSPPIPEPAPAPAQVPPVLPVPPLPKPPVPVPTSPANPQPGWKYCTECGGLFFTHRTPEPSCKAGDSHKHVGVSPYKLNWMAAVPTDKETNTEYNWRFCSYCHGLFNEDPTKSSVCNHNTSNKHAYTTNDSARYVLSYQIGTPVDADLSKAFYECQQCGVLFHQDSPDPNQTKTKCNAGGAHKIRTVQPPNSTTWATKYYLLGK